MNRHLLLAIAVVVGFIVVLFSLHVAPAHDAEHHEFDEWYQALMQPDNPTMSCCGEADAYYADDMHFRDGKTYAVVTDDRPDEPLRRPHIDVGTEVEVPDAKLKWDRGNPTGHGVLFMTRSPHNYVYCYVQPGGV